MKRLMESKSSSADLDFLFSYNGSLYPVKVKNSKAGKLKSLLSSGIIIAVADRVFHSAREASVFPEQKLYFPPLFNAFALADKERNELT